ncbi:hypothetical protein BpHYR1_006590, partial [Brachionus plicatilis]
PQTKRHSQFRKRECLNFSASKVTAIQRGSAVKHSAKILYWMMVKPAAPSYDKTRTKTRRSMYP